MPGFFRETESQEKQALGCEACGHRGRDYVTDEFLARERDLHHQEFMGLLVWRAHLGMR